jgi:hypothetical protein
MKDERQGAKTAKENRQGKPPNAAKRPFTDCADERKFKFICVNRNLRMDSPAFYLGGLGVLAFVPSFLSSPAVPA